MIFFIIILDYVDANVADHDYADCWPCDSFEVSWRYQRLPKYLLTVSHRKEIQTRSRPHCIQLNRTHRMICILTLQSRWDHVTWGQLLTLALCDLHSIFRCVSTEDHHDTYVFPLVWLAQRLLAKISFYLRYRYFDLFTTVTSYLPELKVAWVESVNPVSLYLIPLIVCTYQAWFVF